ncbi:MAG: hypothetical protein FWH22_08075 [Fibromonadales bacterium]|nr:hypothetical protein [Fibromonadales bacterium]
MNTAISIPSGTLTPSLIERVRRTFKRGKVVLLPEKDYKDMLKMARNSEYLAKLDHSFKQRDEGKMTYFTIEELEAMAK